jgi:hypothetical protein
VDEERVPHGLDLVPDPASTGALDPHDQRGGSGKWERAVRDQWGLELGYKAATDGAPCLLYCAGRVRERSVTPRRSLHPVASGRGCCKWDEEYGAKVLHVNW